MTTTSNATANPNLIERVRRILVEPQNEWPIIQAESTDIRQLYVGYVAILAAIPAIFSLLGQTAFGLSFFGLLAAALSWVLTLASVYVAAFIIDKLAITFGSQPNLIQAMKLVAYASTPTYVAGVLAFVPFLGALVSFVAALYGIYLFYLGLPLMMKTPQEQVIPYMLVSAVVMIGLWVVTLMITGAIVGAMIVAAL